MLSIELSLGGRTGMDGRVAEPCLKDLPPGRDRR
jgi:hypothetical protein